MCYPTFVGENGKELRTQPKEANMPRGKTHRNRKLQKRYAAADRRGEHYYLNGINPSAIRNTLPAHSHKPLSKQIIYKGLLPAVDTDGECSKCGRFPNKAVLSQTTAGKKYLVTCSGCDHVMKPHPIQCLPTD